MDSTLAPASGRGKPCYGELSHGKTTLAYSQDKRGLLDCILRPAKDVLDQPTVLRYMLSVLPNWWEGPLSGPRRRGNVVFWRCAMVKSLPGPYTYTRKPLMNPHRACRLTVLRIAYKAQALLCLHGYEARVFVDRSLLSRVVFHGHVPWRLLADATEALNLLDRQGADTLFLPPKLQPGSPWYEVVHGWRVRELSL